MSIEDHNESDELNITHDLKIKHQRSQSQPFFSFFLSSQEIKRKDEVASIKKKAERGEQKQTFTAFISAFLAAFQRLLLISPAVLVAYLLAFAHPFILFYLIRSELPCGSILAGEKEFTWDIL